jgi:hypothetical protein
MHEARHTAITGFLRDTGDLKLAQMLAGHARYVETQQDRQGRPAGQRRPQDQSRSQPAGEWRRRESNPRKVPLGNLQLGAPGAEEAQARWLRGADTVTQELEA